MSVVIEILVVLHLLGWAIAFGGLLATMKEPKVLMGVIHGLSLAIGTGVIILVLAGLTYGWDLNWAWYATKLAIAVVAIVVATWGRHHPERVTRGFLGILSGIIAVNVAIAVLWHSH